ncbi:MAG: NAD(P)H-dependent flavin oxidoreductase [Lachnospiraceae bacterium]
MQVSPLKIGDLTAKYPIVQGGMGVGISLGRLAGTVAREGGVGILSTAQIGYKDPAYDKDPVEANLRAIHSEYEKARKIAPDGILGYNIMVATRFYERYVKEAVKAGGDIIISGAGLPTQLPEYVMGSTMKIAPIVSSRKSASVILKYWDKKYNRTADMVVIEGPLAGGHLGFSREEIETITETEYLEEIKKILEVVAQYGEKFGQKIPVAVAGGIYCKEQTRMLLALGADAVQVGSRFVTTQECDADEAYKQSYIKATEEDIVIIQSPVGMPGRALKNQMIEKVLRKEPIPKSRCHLCISKCQPDQIPYCITDALVNAARGDLEHGLLFCGANACKADRIETVSEVIQSLLPDA